VKFFFPDSQDVIDPSFDFETERHSPYRVRQRDEAYAHEALKRVPFHGILVSKAIVDGDGSRVGRYTIPQRGRLYRQGVHRFFRLDESEERLLAMGDCGAFAYVNEECPPYTVDQVIDFYDECGFDLGISVDHVVLGFAREEDEVLPGLETVPEEDWELRRKLTLELASEFLERHHTRRCRFEPVGAAQGWSASSYADSVAHLQAMGYRRIALGGMVPLKTPDILSVLRAVSAVRDSTTQLHLLGVTRTQHVSLFSRFGVTSFDSTSPFRQAFKDEVDNYYTLDDTFTAVRVPQVEANAKLKRRILAGEVAQDRALELESRSLKSLRRYARTGRGLKALLETLHEYELIYDGRKSRIDRYQETLEARPWEACSCGICDSTGIEVIIFRGSERNKRRGFHNVHVFGERLRRELAGTRRS
jgi:hypothetical protein